MFKNRLRETGRFLLILLFAGIVTAIAGLSITALHEVTLSQKAKDIIAYIAFGLIICILLFGLFKLIQGLVWFIKWLFIEPYKEYKKQKGS